MARLFTINFNFNKSTYSALVSLREQGTDLSCIVRYIDTNLQAVLQGEVLVFNLGEGLKQPAHIENGQAEELVLTTTQAITDYLKVGYQY